MPINLLPPNAVRAIGSSQALSDSASVVKELLDNAIDGGANKISIELSANILDDIRVKDNGHGIAPDDRTMICTKYCTSKIRTYHDLETVGGRTLGFRGEALASAAELSGCLTITTRIEGEGTAVELKFDRKGQISGEKRTSHPVGTTVRVEKFLQNLPVRRQAAEKTTVKMLSKIKRMLQAYALARPHLRLSLKILKAKDRKGDWTYPKSGALSASRLEASLHAATDIFGKKLTNQCNVICSCLSSTGEQMDEATSEKLMPRASRDEVYTLEATMAKRDCDGSVVSNVGHYLSIDSRPVSCTRGTLQQVILSYKSHLRSAASEDNVKIFDPFLCLNITCPPGSYDANVEPAKDDVLFTNSELFLRLVESFFNKIYGNVQPAPSGPPTKSVSRLQPHGIEILLARKEEPVDAASMGISPVGRTTLPLPQLAPELATHAQPLLKPLKTSATDTPPVAPPCQGGEEGSKARRCADTEHSATREASRGAPPSLLPSHDPDTNKATEDISLEPSGKAVPDEAKSGWRGSMYAVDEEEEADLETCQQDRPRSPIDLGLEGDEHVRDVEVSNPWAFAKLNAAMRSSNRTKQLHTPNRQIGDAGDSTDPSSDDFPRQADPPSLRRAAPHIDQARSSPEVAYPTPNPFPFPLKARGKRKADNAGVNALLSAAPSNEEHHKRGALDTWVQKSLHGYDELGSSPSTLKGDQGPPDLPYSRDFISAKSLHLGGTPLSEIPDASQQTRRKPLPRKRQQGNIDRPFVPPVRDPHHVWFDIGEGPSQRRPQKPRPNNDNQDTAKVAPLILRDAEIGYDEADPSLPPIHPDLAITLDYEARKQAAGEAHRKVLRQQAASASKAQTHSPDPLHPLHTTTTASSSSSPHKNRQAKAIAALHHASLSPSPEEPTALDPSDPRAYLLRIHQQQQTSESPQRGKPKRQKTSMLPFESLTDENYLGDLTFLIQDVTINDVEADMKESGAWDRYVQCGEDDGNGFGKMDMGTMKRWEGKIKEMVRELYKEKEGARANLELDLSEKIQAHALESA